MSDTITILYGFIMHRYAYRFRKGFLWYVGIFQTFGKKYFDFKL